MKESVPLTGELDVGVLKRKYRMRRKEGSKDQSLLNLNNERLVEENNS